MWGEAGSPWGVTEGDCCSWDFHAKALAGKLVGAVPHRQWGAGSEAGDTASSPGVWLCPLSGLCVLRGCMLPGELEGQPAGPGHEGRASLRLRLGIHGVTLLPTPRWAPSPSPA